MDAEVRKIRRALVLGALLSPALVMLWLACGLWMEPEGWLAVVFPLLFAVLICEGIKTSPRTVLTGTATPIKGQKPRNAATLGWIAAWTFWMMTRKSPTMNAILDLLSEKGVDWQLLSGLMMMVFWIAAFRFWNAREVTDEQIAPFAEALRQAKEEKRKKAMEPVEY